MGYAPPACKPYGLEAVSERNLMEWFTGKIKLTKREKNERFESNPFGRRRIHISAKDGICNIPLFHHSIIPCVRQDYQATVNIYNVNKL